MADPRAAEDPGWRPALRVLWHRSPPGRIASMLRERTLQPVAGRPANALTALRLIFLRLAASIPLYILALSFLGPWRRQDEARAVAGATIALAALLVLIAAWTRTRRLPTTSPASLARSYQTRMFLGIIVSEAAAFAGIGATFLGVRLWVAVVTATLAEVGMRLVAPSRRNIARDQARIAALGSPLSLTAALLEPPAPGRPGAPGAG